MDKVKEDGRFAHIAKDPKFRRMKVSQRKVQIDKRFQGMFSDKSFKLKYSVDKRGRPVKKTTSEDLRKYYALNESDDEEEGDKKKKKAKEKDVKKIDKSDKGKEVKVVVDDDRFKEQFSSDEEEEDDEELKDGEDAESSEEDKEESEEEDSDEEDEDEDEDENESDEEEEGTPAVLGKGPDIARGEGLESSSSESDDDDDEEEPEEDEDHKWRELDRDAPEVEEATCRLAVCNMDWDRIKAHDLFMLFNSFKPAQGFVKSVHIYPSEYGMQRMKEEERLGPQELRKDYVEPAASKEAKDFEDGSNDATEEREKLRKYQLNRLKYYYAVVECDSAQTAGHIYDECDGREYESSATHIDLRFIPEDMTFDQEPKSVANQVIDASSYKPNLFVNTALQQSKVDCTWDETDRDRLAVTMKKYTKDDLENLDLKDYLASSSDEEAEDIYAGFLEQPDFGKTETEDEEKRLETYKELMQTIKDKDKKKIEKDTELQISWEPGLKENTEEMIKKKKKKETETVWERYLDKKKEKKRGKKTMGNTDNNNSSKSQEAVSDGEESGDDEGISSDDEIPSDVDLNDPYFKEEMEGMGDQGTAGTDKGKLKKRRKKKQIEEVLTPEEEAQKKKEQAELAMLMMEEDDDKEHFSLKAIMDAEKQTGKKKKKRSQRHMMKLAMKAGKKNVQESFKMDVSDERFSAVFDTADYNIDPSASEYKSTKNMQSLINEKLKRKSSKQDRGKNQKDTKRQKIENAEESAKAKDISLKKLVSSVKMKTKSHQIKKKS